MTDAHSENTRAAKSSRKRDQSDERSAQRAIPETVIELGRQFLHTYFTQIGAQVSVSAYQSSHEEDESLTRPDECIFTLSGHLKPLKRNPQYLASLTKLTSIAMSSKGRQRYLCQLDLDGHLTARRALLQVIADDAAAVAKHTHKRAIIEGLSAGERRQIHQQISEDQEVETLSDGEDEFRYLMVAIKT